MAHSILKPLTDDELKIRVGEFMNSFITLNKKNQASLDELKESYHDADLMLYHILRGSNGIVNSTRLLDILLTLVDYSDINSFMEFLKEFADKCHHGKEEGFLFPALEKTGVRNQGGPIGVMLSEHTMDRDLIKQMQDNLRKDKVDSQGFIEAAKSYVRLLRSHIQKENAILFPLHYCPVKQKIDLYMKNFKRPEL